jgi:hypothetical protein
VCVLLMGCIAVAAGCSQGSGLAPINGRVLLENKPVPDMIVNFTPMGKTEGNGALGCNDADGRFT